MRTAIRITMANKAKRIKAMVEQVIRQGQQRGRIRRKRRQLDNAIWMDWSHYIQTWLINWLINQLLNHVWISIRANRFCNSNRCVVTIDIITMRHAVVWSDYVNFKKSCIVKFKNIVLYLHIENNGWISYNRKMAQQSRRALGRSHHRIHTSEYYVLHALCTQHLHEILTCWKVDMICNA